MRVLFLDIDGVVNCVNTKQRHRGFIGIDPLMALRIGRIKIAVPDLEIVLSSSWRHSKDGIDEVNRQVLKIFDVTPTMPVNWNDKTPEMKSVAELCERGKEIKAWLDEWEKGTAAYCMKNGLPLPEIVNESISAYAIVDDDSDMLPEQMPHFFKTSWLVGITDDHVAAIIDHLKYD